MANIIVAPDSLEDCKNGRCLFLAGTITNSTGWREQLILLLDKLDITLINPERKNFDVSNSDESIKQITWEHYALRASDTILFWFDDTTLAPITLYELGCWTPSQKRIYIGMHPDYKRRQDVEIQTLLVIPDFQFAYSIEELAEQVLSYEKGIPVPNASNRS